MLSSWSGRLLLAGVILGGLCLAGASLGQDKKAADPAKKPTIIEVDLSKLPPDVARQLTEALKAREEVKPISLSEAISAAEKAGKGQAIKAEREGESVETRFRIELVSKDGTRTRLVLGPSGKVIDSPEAGKGPPEGKGPPPGKGLGKGKKPAPLEPKK
jgi:uncharacterized membrane protein YkoI